MTRASSVSARDGRSTCTLFALAASAAFLLATSARADGDYWFTLYAAPRADGAFAPKIKIGPFADLGVCYATGWIGMDGVARKNPRSAFRGSCEPGSLLNLDEMLERALRLLPNDEGAPL